MGSVFNSETDINVERELSFHHQIYIVLRKETFVKRAAVFYTDIPFCGVKHSLADSLRLNFYLVIQNMHH